MPIPGQSSAPLSERRVQSVVPAPATPAHDRFEPVALVLAWLLPGAGHFYLGERSRAACIGAGILGLFFGGLLIGGIDVVDSKEDTIWYAGQALVGPVALGVDYVHQNHFKVVDQGRLRTADPGEGRSVTGAAIPASAGQSPPNSKSLGRMNELGTLFATIAGMLNLIAIIDAALHTKRGVRP